MDEPGTQSLKREGKSGESKDCLDGIIYLKPSQDFLGGPVVKNPLHNAEDEGSIHGWRTKIPCFMGQLSLCATTRENLHTATKTSADK